LELCNSFLFSFYLLCLCIFHCPDIPVDIVAVAAVGWLVAVVSAFTSNAINITNLITSSSVKERERERMEGGSPLRLLHPHAPVIPPWPIQVQEGPCSPRSPCHGILQFLLLLPIKLSTFCRFSFSICCCCCCYCAMLSRPLPPTFCCCRQRLWHKIADRRKRRRRRRSKSGNNNKDNIYSSA